MKKFLHKIRVVSFIVLFVFAACSFINGSSFLYTASSAKTPAFVFSRYSQKGNFSVKKQIAKNKQSKGISTSIKLPSNTEGSANWAGYIVTPVSSQGYTSISGSWKVPSIKSGQRNASAGQWIGLGGVSTDDLLQIGTIEQVKNGQAVAEVFWEQLPSVAQNVMTVKSGSTISASISESSDSSSAWNLTFTAVTPDNKTITKNITVTLDSPYAQEIGTSAEWISEDPSNQNDQLYPLANMGTITYQTALVNNEPLNYKDNKVEPIAMVSSRGNILIAPSELEKDGESFSTIMVETNTNSAPNQRRYQKVYPWSYQQLLNWGNQGGSLSWSW